MCPFHPHTQTTMPKPERTEATQFDKSSTTHTPRGESSKRSFRASRDGARGEALADTTVSIYHGNDGNELTRHLMVDKNLFHSETQNSMH